MNFAAFASAVDQSIRIPKATLTEANLPDQSRKVFIVTGGYSGVGFELSKILYRKNGTVYIAGRDPEKGAKAVLALRADCPASVGRLEFLPLDLADLSSIKVSADLFKSKEDRLHVLTNNAGVMRPPVGSKTKQGHELQMGTNCIGPLMFTMQLLPLLQATAAVEPESTVRVTWASSVFTDLTAPKFGVELGSDGSPKVHDQRTVDYGQSKAGNVLISSEFARRYKSDGIVSVAWNPGNLRTDLLRHFHPVERFITWILGHDAIHGAHTELYAGWSSDITPEHTGSYIKPWGRLSRPRSDIETAYVGGLEGGRSVAEVFWNWCETQAQAHL